MTRQEYFKVLNAKREIEAKYKAHLKKTPTYAQGYINEYKYIDKDGNLRYNISKTLYESMLDCVEMVYFAKQYIATKGIKPDRLTSTALMMLLSEIKTLDILELAIFLQNDRELWSEYKKKG